MNVEKNLTSWTYQQNIPSNADRAAEVIRVLVVRLRELQWPEKDTFSIHLAFEEAVMNAVKHGNAGHPGKTVRVTIELDTQQFYARVTDEGEGFDPDGVPDPCDDCNLEKTSGRGVSLIKSLVDRFQYNTTGNSIEIWKSRSHPQIAFSS